MQKNASSDMCEEGAPMKALVKDLLESGDVTVTASVYRLTDGTMDPLDLERALTDLVRDRMSDPPCSFQDLRSYMDHLRVSGGHGEAVLKLKLYIIGHRPDHTAGRLEDLWDLYTNELEWENSHLNEEIALLRSGVSGPAAPCSGNAPSSRAKPREYKGGRRVNAEDYEIAAEVRRMLGARSVKSKGGLSAWALQCGLRDRGMGCGDNRLYLVLNRMIVAGEVMSAVRSVRCGHLPARDVTLYRLSGGQ